MDKRLFLVFGLCILVFLLVGCNTNLSDSREPSSVTDYETGYQGVSIDFLGDTPPSTIREGSNFRVAARVSNNGGYDASGVEVGVVGLNEEWNSLDSSLEKVGTLRGLSEQSPQGESRIVEFSGVNEGVPFSSSRFDQSFWLSLKYDYRSELDEDVCINHNLIDVRDKDDSCSSRDSFSLGGQGSPLAVTSVDQRISPGQESAEIIYDFVIENRGSGSLASSVRIGDAKLGSRLLNCDSRRISLEDFRSDDEVSVSCSIRERVSSPYETTLSLTLEYTYRDKFKNSFTVVE